MHVTHGWWVGIKKLLVMRTAVLLSPLVSVSNSDWSFHSLMIHDPLSPHDQFPRHQIHRDRHNRSHRSVRYYLYFNSLVQKNDWIDRIAVIFIKLQLSFITLNNLRLISYTLLQSTLWWYNEVPHAIRQRFRNDRRDRVCDDFEVYRRRSSRFTVHIKTFWWTHIDLYVYWDTICAVQYWIIHVRSEINDRDFVS